MIEASDGFPVSRASSLPTVTAAEMAEVDGLAVDEFGIDILQMLEQAGSHLAELIGAELGGDLQGRRVVVAVGPGNNGGGGLAAARHLVNRGASVRVIFARLVNRLSEPNRHQLATLPSPSDSRRMRMACTRPLRTSTSCGPSMPLAGSIMKPPAIRTLAVTTLRMWRQRGARAGRRRRPARFP